jgi:hypothetical protein
LDWSAPNWPSNLFRSFGLPLIPRIDPYLTTNVFTVFCRPSRPQKPYPQYLAGGGGPVAYSSKTLAQLRKENRRAAHIWYGGSRGWPYTTWAGEIVDSIRPAVSPPHAARWGLIVRRLLKSAALQADGIDRAI